MGIITLVALITICVLTFTSVAIFWLDWTGVDLGIPPESPAIVNLMGWYSVASGAFLIILIIGMGLDGSWRAINKGLKMADDKIDEKRMEMKDKKIKQLEEKND